MIYPALFLLWLFHFLPSRWRHLAGRGVGTVLYRFATRRRRIAQRNLALCFPLASPQQRDAWVRTHFQRLGESMLDWGVLWWGHPDRIRALVRIEGLAHLAACQGRPVILVAPHFVGMDAGGMRLSLELPMATLYMRPRQAVFDRVLRTGRSRFNNALIVARDEGLRPLLSALRKGIPLYFLPDLDHGIQHSVFAPFFNVPAATLTSVGRLARSSGAAVLICQTRRCGEGYVVEISPPLTGFPSGNDVEDASRINREVEACVLKAPAEYWWLHKRFKTRPPGDTDPYLA